VKDAVDKLAADKALADANSRIAALEKNIGQMQSLLEMQNQRLADAQQRVSPPAEPKPEPKPDTKSETKPDIKDAAAVEHAESAKATPAQTEAAVAEASPLTATKPAGTKPLAALPKVSKSEGLAFLTDDPIVLGVCSGMVLALLIGWLLMRSHRRNEEAVVAKAEPTVEQTVIAESGGRQIDTNHSVFHSNFVPSVSQIDANEVDAVAEADVYIAYGRDEQAEEILLDALRSHPQRHALRVKLLEIYANRKDKQKFGTLAAELRVLTHGQGPEWAQAAQLGQVLDPVNHLYGSPSHTTLVSEIVIPEPESRSPVADFELKLEGLLDERRKAHVEESAQAETLAAHTIDFQLAGTKSEVGTAALTTKLELALACREIGDHDGARELLAEVANARDAELAARAKSLLQQLA
jgi:pilus assembly protein FimV